MASKPDETTQLDCPVCHEDYADPKILPCSHLTCYRCVVSLLRKTVGQGGCPVCGAPIAPPTSLGQGDFVTLVAALPTDLLMVDMVQSKELLGNSNVCCICENDIEATSYCFDCCIKLCKTCAKGHGKYPAFQDHVLEDLKKITVQSLVASHRPKCYSHSDRPAELYCCAHNKLICCECAADSHGTCGDKKKIPESATLKRAELRERAQRLKDKERALSEQVSQIKEQYSAIRAKVKDTFDDLQHAVEKRHQEINTKLQEDELATMASLTELSNYRSALTSNAGSIQHLVTTAPDAFLLGMLEKLALRLDHLEFQSRATGKVKAVVGVNFKPQALALVKTAISRLGHDDARQMLPATEAAVPKPQAPSPVAPRDEEKAAAPDDAEQMVDKTHPKQMINGQWSPVTPEGKKQYDHEFLLKPQASPESRKPRSLSDMPEMADPQRQDVCKTKKNRKELNKKSKEGSDMDAFYDSQASPESTQVAEPEQTEAAPTSAAVPAATVSTVSPPATVEATEADDAVVEPPQQISPAIQVNPDPEPTAPQPQPEARAPVPPVPPPEVKVEEPPKEEKAATPAENGVGGDAEPVVDKTHPKQMINGVQLNYKEGQWSPANPEGKKQYDREFLLKLQANPESMKPPLLPDMPEIMVDPRMLKTEDFLKAQALAAGRTCPDFTPGFFKSMPRSGGPRSVNKGAVNRVDVEVRDLKPYGQLVADAQDQQSAPMAWNPPGTYYLPTANQNMRQPRMQGMNNGQVPGSNLTFMTSMPGNLPFMTSGMTPAYNGNQGLQFVQNPSGQFMQYSQPRMPFPTTMQQQAQMSFVQPYGAPASGTYPGYYPMQIPNTSRPSSVGPQGAGGAVPKQTCNRKMLSLTDPNTGEDITEKVFKPPTTEEVDQNAQEVQEHRNAVTIEFATKAAMLAGDKKDKEGEVSHNVQLSAPAQSAEVPILPTPSKETDAAAASVIF